MSNEIIPYQDIEKMGKNIADSGLFGVKTASQAIALMLVAQALGKHPALAAMEYHIIGGRPAKKVDAMLSDFQFSGGKVEWHELNDTKAEATFSHPQGGSLRLVWDMARAKQAGLTEKEGSMYKKYPRAMLRARLISEGVRTVYPAATAGMRSVEEVDEAETAEHVVDTRKSRLDNIIDAQMEGNNSASEAELVNKQEKSNASTEKIKSQIEKKQHSKSEEAESIKTAPIELKEGQKLSQGFILTPAKSQTVEKDGNPTPKWIFTMGELKYGTFDEKLFNEISAVLDLQNKMQQDNPEAKILINIIYTERLRDGKTLRDIVNFSQAQAQKILPI